MIGLGWIALALVAWCVQIAVGLSYPSTRKNPS